MDGLKTAYAYLGETAELTDVIAELEPLVRKQRDLYRLPWIIQEGAFGEVANGDWPAALAKLHNALEVNRRAGWSAYDGWFVGHIGWVLRLAGDLDGAFEYGRRALGVPRAAHDLDGRSRGHPTNLCWTHGNAE